MYQALIFLHSITRWLVLLSLVMSIYSAYKGIVNSKTFGRNDNLVRHWTATIAHIQLVIGISLYVQSPVIKYFWCHFSVAVQDMDNAFFGLVHILFMLTAIVIITVGSALSKRRKTDKEKFRTMLVWYSIALFIIFLAIPWPFSPLAARPYLR